MLFTYCNEKEEEKVSSGNRKFIFSTKVIEMFQRQMYMVEYRFPSHFSLYSAQLPSLPNSLLLRSMPNPLVNTDMSVPLFSLSTVTSKCFILHSSTRCLYVVPILPLSNRIAQPPFSKFLFEPHTFYNTSENSWFRGRLSECLRSVSDYSIHLTI